MRYRLATTVRTKHRHLVGGVDGGGIDTHEDFILLELGDGHARERELKFPGGLDEATELQHVV